MWVIYKEVQDTLIYWSGTYTYTQMNCFRWDVKEKDWVVSKGRLNEIYQNWSSPIHNVQFCGQNLKEKSNTKYNCNKYEGTKFNGIPKDEKPTIPIKSYKAKYQVHTIQNGMGDIFYIPNPRNEA